MKALLYTLFLIAFPLAHSLADGKFASPPKQLLLLCQAQEVTPLFSDSMYQTLHRIGEEMGFHVTLAQDADWLYQVKDLQAFAVIVSTDAALEYLLSESQKRIFENYIVGSESYSGGRYLRLGEGERRGLSRSSEEREWTWYQELIHSEDDQAWLWETPDEWEEANLPSLRVHGTGKQSVAQLKMASESRVLPHPFPGQQKTGGYIFSTVLGGNIQSYSRNKTGEDENPVFIQHLKEALAWITGVSEIPPADIQLLDFSATPELDKVVLSWITVWEEANDYFEIERALNGVPWHSLDRVKAVGHSPESSRYEYWDMDLHPGHYFYRIKQVDQEGNLNYSDMVAVQIGLDQPWVDLYPNPVRETLFVSVAMDEQVDFAFQIEDREGRMIQLQKVEAMLANEASSIDLSHLVPGIYQLRLMVPDGDVIKTFIKY